MFILGDRHYMEAFSAWLPYKAGKAAVLDIVRQRRNAPSGAVVELLTHALEMLRDMGFEEASITDSVLDRSEIEKFSSPVEIALPCSSARREPRENYRAL